jgi:hypothetical protein
MRTFRLIRERDATGMSGTGVVAEGVEFTDGTVAMRWLSEYRSTALWSDITAAMKVHGHNGFTHVQWLEDRETLSRADE